MINFLLSKHTAWSACFAQRGSCGETGVAPALFWVHGTLLGRDAGPPGICGDSDNGRGNTGQRLVWGLLTLRSTSVLEPEKVELSGGPWVVVWVCGWWSGSVAIMGYLFIYLFWSFLKRLSHRYNFLHLTYKWLVYTLFFNSLLSIKIRLKHIWFCKCMSVFFKKALY